MKSEIGAGTRGASMGVEAIKIASLDAKSDFFRKYESIEVENVNELLFNSAEHAYAKFIDGLLIMEERVCLEVYEQIFDDYFPLIIAGDHSTAYGTIAGIKKAHPKKRLGVIWIDAHADLHSPYTTPSGNMHGMTLAMACDIDNLECKVNDPKGETIEYWEQSGAGAIHAMISGHLDWARRIEANSIIIGTPRDLPDGVELDREIQDNQPQEKTDRQRKTEADRPCPFGDRKR